MLMVAREGNKARGEAKKTDCRADRPVQSNH